MSRRPTPAPERGDLLEALGTPVPPALLEQALTHRSYAYEHGGLPTNERLEFLGDAVLGLVVTEMLYVQHPDDAEGQLAKLRAAVVNMRALAGVARDLGLGPHLLLGRGEEGSGGRDKASILADTVEALIGAVHVVGGPAASTALVHRLLGRLVASAGDRGAGLDWKTSLQELTAARGLGVPEYTVSESGPDHAKRFTATAWVGGVAHGTGEGGSKKEAEQLAAAAAWRVLDGEAVGTVVAADGTAGADGATGSGGPAANGDTARGEPAGTRAARPA